MAPWNGPNYGNFQRLLIHTMRVRETSQGGYKLTGMSAEWSVVVAFVAA